MIIRREQISPVVRLQMAQLFIGKIALINRGICSYISKLLVAQSYGAIGAIIINNVPGPPLQMTGLDTNITIPAVMISDIDGAILNK